MAEGLTPEAKDLALIALFGDGCTLGLTRADGEIHDEGYERVPVTFGAPQMAADGARMVTTAGDVVFGPWRDNAPSPVTGWLVAKGNVVLARYQLASDAVRERQRQGDEMIIRAGMLTIRVP